MVKSVEKKAQALEGYFIHDCVILAPDYVAVSAEEELPEEEYDHYTSRGSSKICTYDFLKQKNDDFVLVWRVSAAGRGAIIVSCPRFVSICESSDPVAAGLGIWCHAISGPGAKLRSHRQFLIIYVQKFKAPVIDKLIVLLSTI